MTNSEMDKMLRGELYDASAAEIQVEQAAAMAWLARYNATLDMPATDRRNLLLERFAAVGEGAVIRPPFHCDYGFNITLGDNVFLNFNCVILDGDQRFRIDRGGGIDLRDPPTNRGHTTHGSLLTPRLHPAALRADEPSGTQWFSAVRTSNLGRKQKSAFRRKADIVGPARAAQVYRGLYENFCPATVA